ncbi:unnamed protein product [Orchesella dallaii]|uniref:C-type lectin domain-containing protein n=1 Tax=Orchesella dallaii TaxID=48710 RepID=A0ABP1RLY1_9HEXA
MSQITMALAFLMVLLGFGVNLDAVCPPTSGPMVRIGDTRYYIYHNPRRRSYNQDFARAKRICNAEPNFRMAQIRNISTFHYLGRQIEWWVQQNNAQDTWYWLDAKFDPVQEKYIWADDPKDPLTFTNFFYRYPRPTGVASQVDWHGIYQKNSTVEQCIAFALPLPGLGSRMPGAMVFGFATTFDEKPCIGRQKRHAICESMLPECNAEIKDPFYLSEDKSDYFNSGHWIIGDRRYIVNWKQRTQIESDQYCKSLGLQLLDPVLTDSALIPHLKLWSRNVTVSQFWTSWNYTVKDNIGIFTDPTGKEVATQRSFIKDSNNQTVTGRSNKDSMTFCVAMQLSYEFRNNLPCNFTNLECMWSFIEHVPANCNNYIGTICTHSDYRSRLIFWDAKYIKTPDILINDPIQATTEFGFKGNTNVKRSKFKQTFGSLVCPPKYRMVRASNENWHVPSATATDLYRYDFLDSYWVVDGEYFRKTESAQCAISVPASADGLTRRIEMVSCTEWHFYVCRLEMGEIQVPTDTLGYDPPKSQGWNWKRHARIYPIV